MLIVEGNKPKRKRRSKKDPNGRMFICDCGKGYLSKLALNNHIKSKHQQHLLTQEESLKKKRGRPKKEFNLLSSEEFYFNSFFTNDFRSSKSTNEFKSDSLTIDVRSFIDIVFNDIYLTNQMYCYLKITKPDDHPFFSFIIKQQGSNLMIGSTCDEILYSYILLLASKANKDYFAFGFKFVVLFRECINKYKNIELENNREVLKEEIKEDIKEFTQVYDAEQIPEMCNEFLTDFLHSANYFGIDLVYQGEFCKIIQHFCFWLYENNYTSSKLLFLSNEL